MVEKQKQNKFTIYHSIFEMEISDGNEEQKEKKSALQLLVVFDTNVLYTRVASDLVRPDVRGLIKGNPSHSDVSIKWLLPSVVIDERRYQMQIKAFELLPSLQKIEKLIGHKLNITKDILIQRINEAIQSELKELNLAELTIDTNSVDWKELIRRSSFREAPFEPGEKEKGFRDSIIAESVFQLINMSPTTPSICRLAIVTDDGILSGFVQEKTADAKNVRILSSLKELENLINVLVSTVTEGFVAEIKGKAEAYFFEPGKQDTLYYKENIENRMVAQYSEELNYSPVEPFTRENGRWRIDPPIFLKKERQRVYWATQIYVNYKLYKFESQESISPVSPIDDLAVAATALQFTVQKYRSSFLTGLPSPTQKKVEAGKGQSLFEINWSITVTQTKKLTSPQIISIDFIGHRGEEE